MDNEMNLKHAEVGKYYRIVKILGKGPVKRRIIGSAQIVREFIFIIQYIGHIPIQAICSQPQSLS